MPTLEPELSSSWRIGEERITPEIVNARIAGIMGTSSSKKSSFAEIGNGYLAMRDMAEKLEQLEVYFEMGLDAERTLDMAV